MGFASLYPSYDPCYIRTVIASAAKQSIAPHAEVWIAPSL